VRGERAHALDGDVGGEDEEGSRDDVEGLALGLAALLVARVCVRCAEAPEECPCGDDLDATVDAEADECHAPRGQTRADGDRGLQDVPRDREPLEPDTSPVQLPVSSEAGRFHADILAGPNHGSSRDRRKRHASVSSA
jgi:hypothetical protein